MSLQGKTLFIWQIKVAKTAKTKLCATKHGIGGPGGLPWSPQGRGEGLRERGKLRVEKVGFPSPFCLTTLQKVEFALLFQKPIQDPSIKLRRSIAKSAAFCSFGTGRLHKAGRSGAKTLVGMTGFIPQRSVHWRLKALCTGGKKLCVPSM